MGSGTTAVACARQQREFVGYEINESYCAIARERVSAAAAAPATRRPAKPKAQRQTEVQ
jgi:site-specific DNA-methyltransferase (adenine-specific)